MKFAITICATKRYTYAMSAQARRVQAACRNIPEGSIILAGDKSEELQAIEKLYERLMPKWKVVRVAVANLVDNHKNYKEAAQLLIAQLRTAAFAEARSLDVDYCWSLDSDVLPPANALDCMMQMLQFDGGYYSISTCPYISQGGGGIMGGRGKPHDQIHPNFYEDEVDLPEAMKTELSEIRSKLKDKPDDAEKLQQRLGQLEVERREKCPSKGNVWKINADHGWKPRGWIDHAYPAIGKGAIVPIDWCGFGCNLMNRTALAHIHFDGYQGKGTEDLFIVWNRWHQAGLRINAILHCLCDHVVRVPGKEGKYVQLQAYHETEGDCVGHIRTRQLPFYSHDLGEQFKPDNDGKLHDSKPSEPVNVNVDTQPTLKP
jgi:hypothetical protein